MNETVRLDNGPHSHCYFSWIVRKLPCQISISGSSGTGKSSLAKEIKTRLETVSPDTRLLSAGEIFRQRGREKGFGDINDFVDHVKKNPQEFHDHWCDSQIVEAGKRDGVIAEGRLVHVFMPYAFHVLVVCDMDVCAARRLAQVRKQDRNASIDRVKEDLVERDRRDAERYQRLYPGFNWNRNCFDVVIDSCGVSTVQEADIVMARHREWLMANASTNSA